jgi:hypothetical protein
MSIKLIKSKFPSWFTVVSDYNERLVQLIKKFEKRYWCPTSKQWSLPFQSYAKFIDEIQCINTHYVDEVSEIINAPKVVIRMDQTKIQMIFNAYIDEFKIFKEIKESCYDKSSKILTFPIEANDKLFCLLKTFNIKYKLE